MSPPRVRARREASLILVTGATGTTGQHVVATLRRMKVPVRVLVRNRGKARPFEVLGAEVFEGDFELPKTVAPSLQGVETAFLLMPPNPRQVEWEDRFVGEAKHAGVRRIVKYSALGADEASDVPFLKWHGEGERRLERSGIAWTHVRPSMFMQNLLGNAAAIRAGTLALPLGKGRVSMVDVRDVAAVCVRILRESIHDRQAYDLTGPEALSGEMAAARLSAGLGWPVTYTDVPPDAFRATLSEARLPEWLADAIALLYADFRAGGGATVTDVAKRIGRVTPRTLEKFAQDHAGTFLGGGI